MPHTVVFLTRADRGEAHWAWATGGLADMDCAHIDTHNGCQPYTQQEPQNDVQEQHQDELE